MYFGGIWGGQLQRWKTGKYEENGALQKSNEKALLPKIAKLSSDLKSFSESPKDIQILDEKGNVLLKETMIRDFLRLLGCTNTVENTISPTLLVILILSVMPQEILLTHLLTKELC
jgi:hypothetical protein